MITSKLPSAAGSPPRAVLRPRCALLVLLLFTLIPTAARAQQGAPDSSQLTPFQLEVEKQRRRLSSSDTEERRDAVMRLAWMNRPESSRVAARALRDSAAIVRATAARAVLR
ncbi:MAG: hypothetical protein LC672_02860, partial [Acidobacteria bacterium]|nr:hypothetical protein [Acidobacteriota bacterium]